MSDTKNAIADAPAPIATSKSASWANWVIGVQGPLLGLILLCVIFTLTTNVFFSVRNALNVLEQVTVLGILAVGMTLVIVIGGIDLSVGSILAFVMCLNAVHFVGTMGRDWVAVWTNFRTRRSCSFSRFAKNSRWSRLTLESFPGIAGIPPRNAPLSSH